MAKRAHLVPPLFVVLSGPSGAGKDTVLRAVLKADSSLATIVTAKTRPPRVGEVDGVNHLFLSESEFRAQIGAGGFLEHAEVYGHLSGVPRDQVRRHLEAGKTVVVRTDVQGARTLRDKVPGAVLVFLTVPDRETLERRLRLRNADSEPELQRRLVAAVREMADSEWFDYIVVNQEEAQAEASRRLLEIIAQERDRPGRPAPLV